MINTFPNKRRWKLAMLGLPLILAATCGHAWPFSGESNEFDLRSTPVNTCFAGESNIFSLDGQESDYDINISATYSATQQVFRVSAYVYDRGVGAVVSSGAGLYRVTQGGQTLASGSLTYAPFSRIWASGNVALTASGLLSVHVTVNGHTSVISLFIPSTAPVHLSGWAKQDNGTAINGGTVRLYNSATVFSATNSGSLPAPLASQTTASGGSFDFADKPIGQYVLTLQTGNGTTIGSAFWLRSGETNHSETIIENPGRADLLNRLRALQNSIRLRVLDRQTDWMVDVASQVDKDIDATPDTEDWLWMLGNIASANVANIGMTWAAGLSASHFGAVISATTVPALRKQAQELGLMTFSSISLEEASSIYNQSFGVTGAILQPYFAYNATATTEINEFDTVFTEDVQRLIDPRLTTPVLNVLFSRYFPIHRKTKSELQAFGTYQFSERWLANYYQAAATALPALPVQFSTDRARRIIDAAEDQLKTLESGTGQIFIGPDPLDVSTSTSSQAPLALNLADYYSKYKIGQLKMEVADWVNRGSSSIVIGSHLVAGASALGVVTAPGAAIAETVAIVAGGVSFGASIVNSTIKADMAGTYIQMGAKYCANIVTAPLALKHTADFVVNEAKAPYYLSSQNSFGGKVNSVSLGGMNIGGREVFFPMQLKYLPFSPPIRLTSEKQATIQFENISGRNAALFRLETKISDFSGVHDHVVTSGGQLLGGQGATIRSPFRSYLKANGLLTAGTFETRLWTGPFQALSATTRDFFVMPINIGFLPDPLSTEQDANVESAMRVPLTFVKTENKPMSGEDLFVAADRVRERVQTNLVAGANSFTRVYAFPANVFSAEFRLYRPVGSSLAFRVEKDGEYIGWDESAGVTHQGFPGEHSGVESNPESIIVPNVGGQSVTVQVNLGNVGAESVNVLLEVWEQPTRSAVIAVLPEAVNTLCRTGITHTVEIAVGESSHQHPLESVSFAATPLHSAEGTALNWSNVSWTGATNIPAAGLKTCSMELDTRGVADGSYTGIVTISSGNVGTITVPITITIDGEAPVITVKPVREWWHNPTGPVVAWTGQDNVTAQSNLLYSRC